ncbi:MAG TPA: hypothetical protein VLQ48_15730 [Chloroflexia bacterium]|nr:hypothetical protein [Chloroflexia bacterium]
MTVDPENNDTIDDEPHLPEINVDELAETVQADETPLPTTPVYMGQTYIGGDNVRPTYAVPNRPMGVTVIAVLNFIGAGLLFLLFIFALTKSADAGLSLYLLPFQVAFAIVVGVGLLQLKPWGRIIALVGYGLNVALDVISLFSAEVTTSTFINFVIAAIFVWYLLRPNVAEAFNNS